MKITERRLRQIIRSVIKENNQNIFNISCVDVVEEILKEADQTVISVMELVYQICDECQRRAHFKIDDQLIDDIQEQMSEEIYPYIDPNITDDHYYGHRESIEYYGDEAVMLDIDVHKFDELVNKLSKIVEEGAQVAVQGEKLRPSENSVDITFADKIKTELGLHGDSEQLDNVDKMIEYVYNDMYLQDIKDGVGQAQAYQDALDYIKSFLPSTYED